MQAEAAIRIRPSFTGRMLLLTLWALGASLLMLQHPQWLWPAQILWALTLGLSGLRTLGINGRHVRIERDHKGWKLRLGEHEYPLTGLRAGLVHPQLATAVLFSERHRYRLAVFADSTTLEGHWQLRRLLIEGLR